MLLVEVELLVELALFVDLVVPVNLVLQYHHCFFCDVPGPRAVVLPGGNGRYGVSL